MGERASGWLLVVLVLAQLALLASRVPDPRGTAGSFLESLALRVAAVPALWVDGADSQVGGLRGFWRSQRALREENRRLREALAARARELILLRGVEAEVDRLATALDYARSRPGRLRPADVIYADHASWLRSLVLRVGDSGAERNAPVVAPEGLVGRVVLTSGPYAKVQLLTDRASSVGAMIERSRRQGVVRGQGSTRLEMDFLPLRSDVRVGDRVVTAGIDDIYPRGIVVGTVASAEPDPSELFLRVEVAPAVDFGRLDQVYLLDPVALPESMREARSDELP